jgi:uncharacterized protein involved in response to NO
MNQALRIEEPATPPRADWALWQLGFRPFYLLAGAFGAGSIALWALQMTGVLHAPYLAGPLWHAHEMLFGFALAVVVGFLFTAGRNWTNQPTPTGRTLAALALLWIAARILVLTPYGWLSAIANGAFPLACAAALARALAAAGNRRNYFFVALLAGLAAASFAVHLQALGVGDRSASAGIQLALDVLLFMLCVMGGRVIPMFTNNGVPGAGAVRQPLVERVALRSVLVLLAADVLRLPAGVVALAAGTAAVAHGVRLVLWRPWRTLRTPLVWVLHFGYAFVAVHLALRAAAAAGWIGSSASAHALTTGAIGLLVIGMMTRTSRGHTARPLRADAWDTACYTLVGVAALVRTFVPLVAPELTVAAIAVSAAAWSLGFCVFTVRYWPVLTRARLDGKPG